MAVVWDCDVVPVEEVDDELELELDELEPLDWDEDVLDEPPLPLEDDEPGPDAPVPPDDAESYGEVT
jgi:hypothetical protein